MPSDGGWTSVGTTAKAGAMACPLSRRGSKSSRCAAKESNIIVLHPRYQVMLLCKQVGRLTSLLDPARRGKRRPYEPRLELVG